MKIIKMQCVCTLKGEEFGEGDGERGEDGDGRDRRK